MKVSSLFRKQSGMTLIELMIAGVLSLIIAYFVSNIVISSNKAAFNSEGSSDAQESARFITTWLQEEIRRAGYSASATGISQPPLAPACAPPFSSPPNIPAACSYDSSQGTDPNDRIAVRWVYGESSPANRDRVTCSGTNMGVSEGDVITDVYWIEVGNQDDGFDDQLWCITYLSGNPVGGRQAIATGIVGLQVLYGISDGPDVDPDLSDFKNVSRYVTAQQLGTDEDSWNNVLAVKLAVLTRSFGEGSVDQAERAFVLLDGEPYEFDDNVTRYPLSLTIDLPNKTWK